MWPYASDRPGDDVSLAALCTRLGELDDELVARLGSDGKLQLAHRMDESLTVATVDLTSPWPLGPAVEQLAPFPDLFKDDVTSSWPELEDYLDPKVLPAIRGPILLLEIGDAIDFYGERPPLEDGAVPTRRLAPEDIQGGWYVDLHDAVSASHRTYVRYRVRPIPDGERTS